MSSEHVFSLQTPKNPVVSEASPRTMAKVAQRSDGNDGRVRRRESDEHRGLAASGECKRTFPELQVHRGEVEKRRSKMCTSRKWFNTPRLSGASSPPESGATSSSVINVSLREENRDWQHQLTSPWHVQQPRSKPNKTAVTQ